MKNMFKNTSTAIALASFAALGGCASTSDLDALRAEVQKANDTANRAASDAAAAQRDAAAAKSTADQALTSAQETDEKLDRMFKKSMYK